MGSARTIVTERDAIDLRVDMIHHSGTSNRAFEIYSPYGLHAPPHETYQSAQTESVETAETVI